MGLPLIHYYPPRHQGYGFAQTPSVPLLGGRNSKASVPKAKTVRWTVFSESVAETLNCEHAVASECELLALIKHTDGGNVTLHPIRDTESGKKSYRHSRVQMRR